MATLQKQLCPLSRMLSPGGWESIFMIAVESKTNREMGKKFALKKVSLYFEQNFKKNLNFSNPYHTILMSYLLWLNVLWCNAVIIRRVLLNSIFWRWIVCAGNAIKNKFWPILKFEQNKVCHKAKNSSTIISFSHPLKIVLEPREIFKANFFCFFPNPKCGL